MADIFSKAKRKEIMSRVKNKRTAPEEAVAILLKELGFRYRRNVSSLPGSPDFTITSAKTALFVNGCFWHGHRNCKRGKPASDNAAFWNHKIAKNRRRDARAGAALRRLGWHVITIWQCRLKKREQVKRRLGRLLA